MTPEELEWEYSKIKEDLAVFRRKNKDVKIAELKAMSIPLKMKLASVTKLQKDYDRVAAIIKDVQAELSEVAEKNDAIMLLCQQRIAQIKEAASKNDMEIARAYYGQVREYYSRLTREEQASLLPKLKEAVGLIK